MVRKGNDKIKTIKEYIRAVEKIFTVNKVYLFGSYASGKIHKWSDIDLAIVSEDFEHMDEYIAMVILSKLRQNIDYSIEAIPLTPDDIRNPPLGSIQYTIVNKGIELPLLTNRDRLNNKAIS